MDSLTSIHKHRGKQRQTKENIHKKKRIMNKQKQRSKNRQTKENILKKKKRKHIGRTFYSFLMALHPPFTLCPVYLPARLPTYLPALLPLALFTLRPSLPSVPCLAHTEPRTLANVTSGDTVALPRVALPLVHLPEIKLHR